MSVGLYDPTHIYLTADSAFAGRASRCNQLKD